MSRELEIEFVGCFCAGRGIDAPLIELTDQSLTLSLHPLDGEPLCFGISWPGERPEFAVLVDMLCEMLVRAMVERLCGKTERAAA